MGSSRPRPPLCGFESMARHKPESSLFKNTIASIVSTVACRFAAASLAADPEIDAASAACLVTGIEVLPNKAPDCSSLKESVTRDCKTNNEKLIAIYNFLRLTNNHRDNPTEPG